MALFSVFFFIILFPSIEHQNLNCSVLFIGAGRLFSKTKSGVPTVNERG